MRHGLALAALLLPLSGCVVPPQPAPYGYGYGYPAPGYPGPGYPGYPAPGYPTPGYPAAYGQMDYVYPGYAYNGGSPTLFVDGLTMPLIFYDGGWGYWDNYHSWHRAPEGVGRDLNHRFPGGAGYRPWNGGQAGGAIGPRQEGQRPAGLRPEGARPEGYPGGGYPAGGFVGGAPHGGNPTANRPPPTGAFQQPAQSAPRMQPAAAPVSRPAAAAAPERHREDDHH